LHIFINLTICVTTPIFENSLKHFENIASQEENTENLFNVMMCLLSLKAIGRASAAFEKIIATHRGIQSTGQGAKFLPQLSVPYIKYYYACGCADAGVYDEAFLQLEELKKIYIQLKITDGTFLYLRGIPFFDDFIQLAKKVFTGQKKDFINSVFLKELMSSVDSDGKTSIQKICEAIE